MSTSSPSPAAPRSAPATSTTRDTASYAAIDTPRAGIPVVQHPGGCPNCGDTQSWGSSDWCPCCGFYPKLGITVSTDALRPLAEEEKLEPAELPTWVWVAGGGIVFTLAVSLYARFCVPVDGPRTIWSLATLAIGLLLFGASHVQAYLVSASGSDRLGLMDLFLGPAAVWRAVMQRLPDTRWLVCRGTWGLTLIVCGLLVVGGLGWDELSQLAAAKAGQQEKFNPMQQMFNLARNGGNQPQTGAPESLEDAMQQFVGEIGADEFQGIVAEQAAAPAMKKQCAIIGYTRSVKGELRSVLLASVTAGRPDQFVAKVPVDQIPPAFIARLEAMLPELRTSRPSIPCPMQAHWVRPELSCMIGYDPVEGDAEQDWTEAEFLELLDKSGVAIDMEQVMPTLEDTHHDLERSLPQLQEALAR